MCLNGYLHIASILGVSKRQHFELFSGWKWKFHFSFMGLFFHLSQEVEIKQNTRFFNVLQTTFLSVPKS